jgi:hypothetical protein
MRIFEIAIIIDYCSYGKLIDRGWQIITNGVNALF